MIIVLNFASVNLGPYFHPLSQYRALKKFSILRSCYYIFQKSSYGTKSKALELRILFKSATEPLVNRKLQKVVALQRKKEEMPKLNGVYKLNAAF